MSKTFIRKYKERLPTGDTAYCIGNTSHITKYVKLNSKGLIPAGEFCPFKNNCNLWLNKARKDQFMNQSGSCIHKGTNHKTEYSCGVARGFDFELNYKQKGRSLGLN
ncbi:MAG: hypothetical protein H8D97_01325 [Proteobacteria bacterium]|nr:hypothetical protein [Pseudomonadota bacterium]